MVMAMLPPVMVTISFGSMFVNEKALISMLCVLLTAEKYSFIPGL